MMVVPNKDTFHILNSSTESLQIKLDNKWKVLKIGMVIAIFYLHEPKTLKITWVYTPTLRHASLRFNKLDVN